MYLSFSPVFANEAVKLAGMGGAFVGIRSTEGAIFGNPAGLIDVRGNNLSIALSAQDLDYEILSPGKGERLSRRLAFRLSPSIYYSRVIGGFGIGLGYVDDLDNRSSTFKIEDTEAEYIVDERKFTSDTNTVLEYDFFREKRPVFSVGCPINPMLAVGIRLKYRNRVVKEGTIYRPMHLEAVHGEDVNRNDATKLLPAVIDNLDIEDTIERFKEGEDGYEEVEADLSGGGLDLDLGIQARLSPGAWASLPAITAGFMLDHLIQRRVVNPEPSKIRFGVGAQPTEWLVGALDFQKALGNSGLPDLSLGWEVCYRWQRWFSGGVMIRSGYSRCLVRDSGSAGASPSQHRVSRISVGIGLVLGDSHWDYALVKPLDGSPIHKAGHTFSSTTRF